MVDTAIHARQVDLWAKREDRKEAILEEILTSTTSKQDGAPTCHYRELSYQLYNTMRHRNGHYGHYGKQETNGQRHKP